MVIDDLIILGTAVPEEIKDGRRTICTAGYSPTHGFVRIYPTNYNMPLTRWNIIKVPVERPITPHYNGRTESWKIIGSNREWDMLYKKVETIGVLPQKERQNLVIRLIDDCCVSDLWNRHRSLGIVQAEILEHYFKTNEDLKKGIQTTLDKSFRVSVKDEFPIEPRIKYKCSNCTVDKGYHDQQLLEWGAYMWLKRSPDKAEQLWENLGLDNPDYEKYLFVGNLLQYPTAFAIISILRFKKQV